MKVAVVTPYCRESEFYLRRCINSVKSQSLPATHYLVADGYPQAWLDGEAIRHVRLDQPYRDFGDTPRGIGSLLAIRDGHHAIAYLDADNYYQPEHLQQLAQIQQETGADVVTSSRFFIRPDGSRLEGLQDEDPNLHTDTSCYFLARRALRLASLWAYWPRELSSIDDRMLWLALKSSGLKIVHVPIKTVAYTTLWTEHYLAIKETPPAAAKSVASVIKSDEIKAWWAGLSDAEKNRLRELLGIAELNFV